MPAQKRLLFAFIFAIISFLALSLTVYFFVLRPNQAKQVAPSAAISSDPAQTGETPVQLIPLSGAAARSEAEHSGLGWYGDLLILLPQYPARFENHIFALPRSQVLAYLDGQTAGPLQPLEVPFADGGLSQQIAGFEGFESIVFPPTAAPDVFYATIEASPGAPLGYLVRGQVIADPAAPAGLRLRLEPATLTAIPAQASLSNYSDEAALFDARTDSPRLYTFYEANGANVNPDPVAHTFAVGELAMSPLTSAGDAPMPNLEYRLTDASAPDANGRFWVINYLFPDDRGKLKPAADPLSAQYGQGASHASSTIVERLVQFELPAGDGALRLADTPPIQLQLQPDGAARNWEGLVELPGRGFLLITDKFPTTLLAFVPWDGQATP